MEIWMKFSENLKNFKILEPPRLMVYSGLIVSSMIDQQKGKIFQNMVTLKKATLIRRCYLCVRQRQNGQNIEHLAESFDKVFKF